MLDLATRFGITVSAPEYAAEDEPSFSLARLDDARSFYHTEGYVVLRDLVSEAACDEVRAGFDHVRHSDIPMLRQKTMRYEPNILTPTGLLDNPIFNIQDLETRRCDAIKRATLDLLTAPGVIRAANHLLGVARSKIVQSMFFEAPAGTWPHQDTYYQDSALTLGRCVAGWFALEDIEAGAGRFFVCPRSHRDTVLRNEGPHNIAHGHERYKQMMADAIRRARWPLAVPCLAKGDVLFWNSLTVHGSLDGADPALSRASLTSHFLPERDPMLQFHTRVRPQRTRQWSRVTVGLLHDQDRWRNRLVRDLAYRFPRTYMTARELALRCLLRARSEVHPSGPARPSAR
jgi:phytanoyl-CoA hydroxylase